MYRGYKNEKNPKKSVFFLFLLFFWVNFEIENAFLLFFCMSYQIEHAFSAFFCIYAFFCIFAFFCMNFEIVSMKNYSFFELWFNICFPCWRWSIRYSLFFEEIPSSLRAETFIFKSRFSVERFLSFQMLVSFLDDSYNLRTTYVLVFWTGNDTGNIFQRTNNQVPSLCVGRNTFGKTFHHFFKNWFSKQKPHLKFWICSTFFIKFVKSAIIESIFKEIISCGSITISSSFIAIKIAVCFRMLVAFFKWNVRLRNCPFY